MTTMEVNTSTDGVDSKESYHETFREVDNATTTASSDTDVKDMSRMGKDQQFNVGSIKISTHDFDELTFR